MSDALVISYVPGYTFTAGEIITIDKLNALARPTINLAGTIGSALVADNSITTVKLVDGVLSADAAGRAKMADGYFSADATGRGKFAAGFFGAGDAESLALFADGFWTADAAGRAKFADGFFDSLTAAVGSTRNLTAFNNAGSPNSQVDITADEVMLKTSSGSPYLATGVSVTINIATNGANGLDTGTEAGNVWYYLWLIYNGTTVAGLLSTSSTAPTLPSGYTYQALTGVVRNDGSSNFMTFYQQDRDLFLNDSTIFSGKTGITSGLTALSGTPLTTFQGLVPPIARQAWGNSGNSSQDLGIMVAADANGLAQTLMSTHSWRLPLKTPQQLYYKMPTTDVGYLLSVNGFKI